MADDPKTEPTNVKAPHGARVMEIDWADGHKAILPHEILRGYCPCAHCQGHGGTIKFVPGGDLDLRDIQQVGNYALQFTWGDRHDSGLYTYRYLQKSLSVRRVQTFVRPDACTMSSHKNKAQVSAPKSNALKGNAPKSNALKGNAPKGNVPKSNALNSNAPKSNVLKSNALKPSDNVSRPKGNAASDPNRIIAAEFLAGAAPGSSLPAPICVEIAFGGRSNVGKSSLINTLVERKSLVRTSSKPGSTRQINQYEARAADGTRFHLIDLPGYGFTRRSEVGAVGVGGVDRGLLAVSRHARCGRGARRHPSRARAR